MPTRTTISYLANRVADIQPSEPIIVDDPSIVRAQSYLKHHGVKGQKWGERHGPPYPLDSSVSTGSSLKTEPKTSERHKGGAAKTSSSSSKSSKSDSSSLISKVKQYKKTKDNKKRMEKVRAAKAKKAEAKKVEVENAKLAAARKAEEEEKAKLRQDQISEAIRKGDKKEIQRLSTDMTNEQLDAAVNRMNKLKTVYDATYIPPNPTKIEKAKDFVKKSANWAANDAPNYIKAYNNIAGVVNSINESPVMPQIDLNFSQNYQKQQQQNNNDQPKHVTSPAMEQVIRSGDKRAINAYASHMTDDELKRAMNRAENYEKLRGQQSQQQNNNNNQQQNKNNSSQPKFTNSNNNNRSEKDLTDRYTISAPSNASKDYKKAVDDYNKAIKKGDMKDLYSAQEHLEKVHEKESAAREKEALKREKKYLKKNKPQASYSGPSY